ncbi:ABC transporter, substrate-binding protein, family 5 [Acetobacteraceae bacterium AT-5844]|nr:ABC transporter, substrate-binding protein, family 5 [Acetobacteraceae bacterium AT-5844]
MLVARDAQARPIPALAESWRAVSETVWEFKLRPGVRWHDGQAFTAEDVAFSLARVPNVPNSPGSFAPMVRAITRVEVVDPLTVRLHTAAPHPLLPNELGSIFMVSKHVGEGATTENYNSGKALIGTGPYRLVSYAQGERVEMVRNDAHWAGVPAWQNVSFRFIPNDGARTAAILSGDVDMVDQVPMADLAKLRGDRRVALSETPGFRLLYMQVDHSREGEVPFVTDNAGRPLPRNPFKDVRVRRALSMAINRQAIVERVMEGAARPTGQFLPQGVFSWNPEIPVPAYDPDGAKRLLAEAGYPDGFRMVVHSPNDRYPNDSKIAQAVAQMWTRIGLTAQVDALPWASFSGRSARQEFGMRLAGGASVTGEATYPLTTTIGTFTAGGRRGGTNVGRYSNPALDAMVDRAAATVDDTDREAQLRAALKLAMDDVAIIPLLHISNIWALRPGLRHTPRMDERTSAIDVAAGG